MSDPEDDQVQGAVSKTELTVAPNDSGGDGTAEPKRLSADLCARGDGEDLDAGDLSLDELNDNLVDYGDNLSLEVNFGDGSSCRASDVSSLSFQNIVLDDLDNPDSESMDIPFHRDSVSESSDSPLNDFPNDDYPQAFGGHLVEKIKDHEAWQDKLDSDKGFIDDDDDSTNTGTMKRKSKSSVSSDHRSSESGSVHCDGGGCPTNTECQYSYRASSYNALQGREKQTDEGSGGDCGESAASDSTSKCSQSADTDPGDSDHTKAPSSGNSDQNTTPSIESLDFTSPNSIVDTHVKKRNSLEVRNNIPDVNEVKSYDNDLGFDLKKVQAQGAVPKMKKKSPGLARRLADPLGLDDRDTSSSERETESALLDTSIISAQKDFESQLRNGSASFLHYAPKSRVPPTDSEQGPTAIEKSSTGLDSPQDSHADPASFQPQDSPSSQPLGRRSESPDDLHRRKEASLSQRASSEPPQTNHVEAKFKLDDDAQAQDVENEYDYVKYSRIQQGDSYVGMRLAYSSSNDSLSLKRSLNMARSGSEDDQYCISSQEQSPKKVLTGGHSNNHMINEQIIRVGKVNEETLTEISLNGSENLLPEEQKNFTLSPEATECDSAEVESVLSDEGRSSTSGMPLVEDGLSSSQGSDTEEVSTYDMQRPAEILKRRFKAQMESELQQHPPDGMDSDGRSCSVTDDNSSQMSSPSKDSRRRDEVDLALQDIQSAIQCSKGVTLKSPYNHEEQEEEPVWVMRYVEPQVADSYVRKIQRHDEMRQIRGAEDGPQEGELGEEKLDQVHSVEEEEEDLLKYQYSRHEGKSYPQTRGFESDDDYEEHDRHIIEQTRRNKGNKYGALPVDDPNSAARRSGRVQGSSRCPSTHKQHPLSAHSDTNLNHKSSHHSSTSSLDSGGHRNTRNFSSSLSHSRYYPNAASTGNINSSHSEPASRRSYMDSKAMSTSSDNVGHKNSPAARDQQYTNSGEGKEGSHIYNTSPYHDRCYHQNDTAYQDNDTAYHDNDLVCPPRDQQPPHDNQQAPPGNPPVLGEVEESEEEYQEEIFNRKPNAYIRTAEGDFDTDEETDELLDKQYASNEKVDIPELSRPPVNRSAQAEKRRSRAREGEQESLTLRDPDDETVLIEGVLFRARYLGSTQLISEGNPSKAMRMMQAQEAVGRIKAPEGESQPSTEVDLFVSVEKIMILNTDLQEIMMDHALRTISYIADIGDILVIMARRGPVTSPTADGRVRKQSKICCHVFESEEAQLIAQSIGQAFQVAYMEFLKANGIDDPGLMKEMDYQEVLNQQEIYGEELGLFSNKEMQKEVIVPKLKNEPLGVVIVESGWGSMVPTVVLANMAPSGAAARCGQLNIGDQIMSINGVSLVGLPLSSCQNYIKAAKNQTVVKLNVVSCPPVVEVLIKRPDVKYQLGFSVQNGVICSLLRGGIAERGGVRVGHRIIEINGSSVVAVPHEKIVSMLATSVGEIHMKTMPTSIFRLLTGQDTPHFM